MIDLAYAFHDFPEIGRCLRLCHWYDWLAVPVALGMIAAAVMILRRIFYGGPRDENT